MTSSEMRSWDLDCEIVYGPILSRRFGHSLGINLLPSGLKVCDFDCLYCQCGWTSRDLVTRSFAGVPFPTLNEIELAVNARFEELQRAGSKPDTITFSGNGEPTLYPAFREAVEIVANARNTSLPGARLGLLTNGCNLLDPLIFETVATLDLKSIKFDAGREWLDRPLIEHNMRDLLRVWRKIENLTLQSFFCGGQFDNTQSEDVDPWLERLAEIRPSRLQLYTLDRVPPVSTMSKASEEILNAIAERIRGVVRTTIVEVFPGK